MVIDSSIGSFLMFFVSQLAHFFILPMIATDDFGSKSATKPNTLQALLFCKLAWMI